MELKFFANIKRVEKAVAIEKLVKDSSPSQQFFFMVLLSVLMATFGVLQNNVATIIGSMMIAPVLYPVLGIAMGLIMSDSSLLSRSLVTVFKSFLLAVGTSLIASILFSSFPADIHISTDFIKPSLISVAVAIVAGLAASLSLVKKEMSETLPGVAISVSLVPPLAVIGVGLSGGSFEIVTSAFLLFVINVLGIIFASMLTFSLMNFYVERRAVHNEIIKDDRELEHEKIIERENNDFLGEGRLAPLPRKDLYLLFFLI